MATEKQGIMSLPQGGEEPSPQMPQMGLEDSYDAVKGGLQDVSPAAHAAMQQTLDQITPQLDQLSDQQLDAMVQIFQYLHAHPEEYDAKVKDLISKGVVQEGTLPDAYDPEILATLIMVFLEAKKQRQSGNQREAAMAMPQPPAGMARGGIAEAARMVASQGRSGDTMLAHINKKEAKMLKKHGGVGTINPATGLPEYGFFNDLVSVVTAPVRAVGEIIGGVGNAVGSVVNGVVNTIKSVVQSPVGRILGTIALATVLGPTAFGAMLGSAGTAAVSAGAITALGGGNLQDVLRSAATSYLAAPGGPVESFIGNAGAAMGVTNAAGQAAINAGITGAGVGLLTGQSLQDSVKSGLIAGAIQGGITGSSKGFDAQAPGMSSAPTGDSVSGKWNSETGRFEAPVTPADVQKQIQAGGGSASTDPLGDFIQRNELDRQAASTPAGAAGASKFSPVPTIGESASRIGGGLSDIVQGNFSQGFEGVKGGLGDLFMPGKMTPDQLAQTDAFKSVRANGGTYADAIKAASDSYNPGILRTYGPAVIGGLAATGAMGGFEPGSPPQSEMMNAMRGSPGEDLIKANPSKYITQNLPGVEYDSTGNIIGSKPWSPSATMSDVRVASNPLPMGPMGSVYTPGPGTVGQSPRVYQPYNTAGMYSNLMQNNERYGVPREARYAANGGMIDEPVQHRFSGGAIVNILREIPNFSPPAAMAPISSVVKEAPVPVASPTATPTSQVSPQLPTYSTNPMSEVRATTTNSVGRMTPEMQAEFARRFAQNLQFDPGVLRQAVQPQPTQQYNNTAAYSRFQRPKGRGLASLAEGGYPRRKGQISGPGTEKSDSIPAMLSDGEFVMTAKAVRGAGSGSRRAGAKKMYALMHQLERNASRG